MNKRQRNKQRKKTEERLQRQAWEQREQFIKNINAAVAKVKGWIEEVPKFINKQVQERPEEIREQLLGKEGKLLGWEQLLLDKVEAEIRRRIEEIGRESFIDFDYTNWKGEQGVRVIRFEKIFFGFNDYHDGEQYFVRGYDMEKKALRDFAFKDMRNILEWSGNHDDQK